MKEQNVLISKYLEVKKNPTLKKISKQTGINQTRVFRLLNGAPMKLSEYLSFKAGINNELKLNNCLGELALKCFNHLSKDSLKEIENLMINKLTLKQYLNQTVIL